MAKKVEYSVEEKLRAMYDLQLIDSRIDKIKSVRGELPLEVEDLEDEIEGLEELEGGDASVREFLIKFCLLFNSMEKETSDLSFTNFPSGNWIQKLAQLKQFTFLPFLEIKLPSIL